MATPQLSPGVLTREVDLTQGRVDNLIENIGAFAGPFPIGPVGEPVNITTEQDLINVFGKPLNKDSQYEYWMSASSFLTYGGSLKVVRSDGSTLVNANAIRNSSGVSTCGEPTLKIKNYNDYELNHSDDIANYIFAAKNPGSWANNLKVCIIDDKADQTISVTSTTATATTVGMGISVAIANQSGAGIGVTAVYNGYLKGIVTGKTSNTLDVKLISFYNNATSAETAVNYKEGNQLTSILPNNNITVLNSAGVAQTAQTLTGSVVDWYDQQTLNLTNGNIFWKSIAPKPVSSQFVTERNGDNDSVHVVVVDDNGTVTGVQGNLLEKHLFLSKATDAISGTNSPQKIWWKDYLAQFSNYVYVGDNPSDNTNVNETVVATGFSTGYVGITTAQGLWNLPAQSRTFSAIGNVTYNLTGGVDYDANGGMVSTLGDIVNAYRLFNNKDEVPVDYLIMGPGLENKVDSQAKAAELIAIANQRKDCLAVVSPHKADIVNQTNRETQTNNILSFYAALPSSSYAIFDDNYKYTYDRFNNKFRYIPTNADIAGLCVRTSIFSYPWFSPAGQQRGVLNNAIKLAYNSSREQRDRLYSQRINSIISQTGVGIILYGDKTALGYDSAFDRINVRRLFLAIEKSLESTAQAQLFEINDEITQSNFVNIVEPYLRDIQAKRGLYDFRVICDSTNNTPDVVDNNEFRGDIYLKPTKSINYVTLTYVATRTGVSFEEVTGRV